MITICYSFFGGKLPKEGESSIESFLAEYRASYSGGARLIVMVKPWS